MVTGVSQAIPFDPRGLMSGRERGATLATIAALRRERYDVVLDLQGLVKSAVVARFAGGSETIGFPAAELREPAARFFYTRTGSVPAAVHVVHKNLALLASIGVTAGEPRFALQVPADDTMDRLADSFAPGGFIAVNPGAGWPNKRWPPERFGQAAAALNRAHGVRAVVLWGPGEESLARTAADASGGVAVMAPATSIRGLFRLLGRARLMIAGDTGPLQIAAAVGAPVVGLFGPTDAWRNGPWHDDDVTISRRASCDCHYERRCRRAAACIDDITVDEVVAAAGARLTRAPGGSAP
jgi:ADP-heptose:LPS heptosyltransferase